MLRQRLLVLFLLSLAIPASAQLSPEPGTILKPDSLSLRFERLEDETLPIYDGRFFYGYTSTITGIAFYSTNEWRTGSILYDGTWYFNIPMLYNLVTDQVVVMNPKYLSLSLYSERVEQFMVGGETFVHLRPDKDHVIKDGFYKVLSTGRVTAYGRYVKILDEKVTSTEIERRFIEQDHFYILKDGVYYSVGKQGSFLGLLKENRQQISQYLKQQGIRFRKAPEKAITLGTNLYNQSHP